MADRLSRRPERTPRLFLADALLGGERAVGDRLGQPLVGLVDQRRLEIKRLHSRAVC